MEYKELIEAFAAKHGIGGLEVLDGAAALDIDEMRIAFLNDENAHALILLGEIGSPPPEASERFDALLMRANYLFRGSDGATFAQNPETNAYALMRSLPLALLDATILADAVQGFVNTLERWRRTLADFRPADKTSSNGPSASVEELMPFGASGFLSV